MSVKVLYGREIENARCGVPGCTHESHDGLFLHQRCHWKKGVSFREQDGILYVTCRVCKFPVVNVAVVGPVVTPTPTCHPDAKLWLYYHRGWLQIVCGKCEGVVGRIEVRYDSIPAPQV